ncbi:hypothetical protein [Ancylomarina sp. 16SWW S1-10-2]|uniref:hypothetical protein n=1 Tax=Ancylomarina sp. 16SWW S1-10-2 TaxID=2499681 RepID=UPI0012AE7FC4|nr:hypothetical protein [Ancylomarina sp. 16SWW S1-10-2]MRT92074.1 hypothetical protein [Ancylomarina sp. 16SWW S1-10-2]
MSCKTVRTKDCIIHHVKYANIDLKCRIIKIDSKTAKIEYYTENGKLEHGTTEYFLADYFMIKNFSKLVDKWEW